MTARCPAGHELPGGSRQAPACPQCRRETLIRHVITVDETLTAIAAAAAVDAAAATPAALRSLASALAADPDMLAHGAPPLAGRLAAELIARGSACVRPAACARCGRDGRPLFRTAGGGMCKACTARTRTAACAHCGEVKAIAGRDACGGPICERCRRHARGHRTCGHCGREASIAVRAHDKEPDICVSCYRLPAAVCAGCGRNRPCNFAGGDRPLCPPCSPKATSPCARCGQDRPPAARWPEGPVCDTCYTAALRRRARCAGCGQERRLIHPPGPDAVTCADCAGLPAMSACAVCGTEDKLYDKGLCARCSLRRRATELLSGGSGDVPAAMTAVLEAICAARNPRSALNWLRKGAGAAILSDIAAGAAATHEALDEHPRPRAAGFLRQVLTAGSVLAPRDEELTRAEQWLTGLLESLDIPEHRRLVRAFATWQVMRRLRHNAQARPRQRTRTAAARNSISEATRFLAWLSGRGTTLRQCRQADIDEWLTTASASASESTRGFLDWAARHGHCQAFAFPPGKDTAAPRSATASAGNTPPGSCATTPSSPPTGPPAASSCSTARTSPASPRSPPARSPATTTRCTSGSASTTSPPARPRHDPGHPHHPRQALHRHRHARTRQMAVPRAAARTADNSRTPLRTAQRHRHPRQGRPRAALTGLAAQVPAAVLADALGIHPTTAVTWTHDAGSVEPVRSRASQKPKSRTKGIAALSRAGQRHSTRE